MIENFTIEFFNRDEHIKIADFELETNGEYNSRNQCRSIGLVVVAYNHENYDGHIPIQVKEAPLILNDLLKKNFNWTCEQIVVGHEHANTENKQCHWQCCIEFTNKTNFYNKWFKFSYDGLWYKVMTQVTKNSSALKNYCKKEKDFAYLYPEKVLDMVYKDKKNGKGKVDPYMTVVKNKDKITQEEAVDLIRSYDPREYIRNSRNINYFISNELKPQLPEFQWVEPRAEILIRYPLIKKWWENWCKPEGLTRRKALLLYSSERALGKSSFAMGLVNDETFVVRFKTTFLESCVKGKDPKLVVLDDMNHWDKANNLESWKALCAGEPTNIREAYTNFEWRHRVPCIICTNNISMVNNMRLSSDFSTQVIGVEIRDYMGPEGTRPIGLDETEWDMGFESNRLLALKEKEREEFKESKKTNIEMLSKKRLPDKDMDEVLLEKDRLIRDLKDELAKMKNKLKKMEQKVNDPSQTVLRPGSYYLSK